MYVVFQFAKQFSKNLPFLSFAAWRGGVGAGNFLGIQNFPKILPCEKLSPYKLSVAVRTLYFPLPQAQNIKFGT